MSSAAAFIINPMRDFIMSARSVTAQLQNTTDLPLMLLSAKLSHGAWSQNMYPPTDISGNSNGAWASQSDGFMTGTEGTLTYMLAGAGQVTLHWDNPFAGSNKYTSAAPSGYEISHSGGGGNKPRNVLWRSLLQRNTADNISRTKWC